MVSWKPKPEWPRGATPRDLRHGTEVLGRGHCQQTRPQLREHLNDRPFGGIIFTTIQKFVPGEGEDHYPSMTERDNVVVLCEEAHRSQWMAARINKEGETIYGYAKYFAMP